MGLAAGCIAVIFTEQFGAFIASVMGIDLAWGRWPLTIHSAGWGMLFNLSICLVVSAITQNDTALAHRMQYHNFLREHATLSVAKQGLKPVSYTHLTLPTKRIV